MRGEEKAAARFNRRAARLGFAPPSPPSPGPIEPYFDDEDTCFDPAMALVKPLSDPLSPDGDWDGINESGGRAYSGTSYPYDLGPWTGKGDWVWVGGMGWRWQCDVRAVKDEEEKELRAKEDAAVEG